MENKIKAYYINQRKLNVMKNKLKDIRFRIEEVEKKLTGSNISLKTDLGCQKYNNDIMAKGGKPSSKVEQEIESLYKQLESLLEKLKREEANTLEAIFKLETDIHNIEYALEQLDKQEIELLEARYKKHNSVRQIAYSMFGGIERTAYRNIRKVLGKLEVAV